MNAPENKCCDSVSEIKIPFAWFCTSSISGMPWAKDRGDRGVAYGSRLLVFCTRLKIDETWWIAEGVDGNMAHSVGDKPPKLCRE